MISRSILTELCSALPQLDDNTSESVSKTLLDKIQQRVISFEDQVRHRAKIECASTQHLITSVVCM